MKRYIGVLLLVVVLKAPAQQNSIKQRIKQFESELISLQHALHIPGMSVAIVKDQHIIWSKGFGYADLENKRKATATTPYVIASITKPVATTLFLQLMEQGKVSLNDPLKMYHYHFQTENVRVKHILTHTAGVSTPGGKPGDKYAYSGSWFGYLGYVIAKGANKPYRNQLVSQILEPLHMDNSVPGMDILDLSPSPADSFAAGSRNRYEQALSQLAKPYNLYGADQNVLSPYPPKSINSAAGLISTVEDLAKFDIGIDRHELIKKETQDIAWTQSLTNDGNKIPYGLGWFVQEINGLKLIWHYGQWPVFSGLLLKIPEKNITLILLANSTGACAPFDMAAGDVQVSPFALAFLRAFALESSLLQAISWEPDSEHFSKRIRDLKNEQNNYTYEAEMAAYTSINNYLKNRLTRVRNEMKEPLATLDVYAGKYALDSTQFVFIKKNAGLLTIEYPGQSQSPINLFAETETQFFAKIADVQSVFAKRDGQKFNQITLITNGKEQIALRVE